MQRAPPLLLLLAGCLGPSLSVLPPSEVESNGRHRFEGAPVRVFRATLGGLRAQGYGIAYSDQGTGVIHTNRRLVGYARERAVNYALYRQYVVTVVPLSATTAELTVAPRLYYGDTDISGEESWDLNEERRRWSALFAEIDRFLAAPQVMPSEPAGL